jgi:hypothetical protein
LAAEGYPGDLRTSGLGRPASNGRVPDDSALAPHRSAPDSGDRTAVGSSDPSAAASADGPSAGPGPSSTGCTAPQLRRFIKSRAYVPMHELRRRFGINGAEDEVTRVALGGEHIYVGLPGHEGELLGELLRGGEVGYELSLDPRTPVVVGVYPMRPVPRH